MRYKPAEIGRQKLERELGMDGQGNFLPLVILAATAMPAWGQEVASQALAR
jgi:hypothetical protein